MPIQAPQWTEFLSCPVCRHSFTRHLRPPISLGCSHTICQQCLSTLQRSQCPFDQTAFRTEPQNLPINYALLQLILPSNSNNNNNNPASYDAPGSITSSTSSSSTTITTSTATTAQSATVEGSGAAEPNNNNKVTSNVTSNKNGDSPSAEVVPLSVRLLSSEDFEHYSTAKECIEALALYLRPSPTSNSGNNNNPQATSTNNLLTRQMQRKVVALICCQLFEEEGRSRAVRAARLLGERAVTELILHHQNPQQLSANLWAAVRARGCQFLGPAMQEEVLKLVLLALEDGSALSRKVLVMFVVQRLEPVYAQASKTSIGHVVQLLYRASCFKVSKREGDSSLMQLKEEFRTYEALRREHDTQIVQIATEAGLRIAPDQWSSLLYGDTTHKSHMQSINDKLQTPESFSQSVQELVLALQRTSDPAHLSNLQPCLKYLADIDPNAAEQSVPTWQQVAQACSAVRKVVTGLADFVQHHGSRKLQEITNANPAPKYKVNMCWIYTQRGSCPRGNKCNFAHSEAELNQSKARHSNNNNNNNIIGGGPGVVVGGSSRQSMPPGAIGSGGLQPQPPVPPQQMALPPGTKDDYFMLDQFNGKKPQIGGPAHMQADTSPMRFPGGMPKGSPLPPQPQPPPPPQGNNGNANNNLLLPQPYPNGPDMMGMGPMGPPPPPPPHHPHHPHHPHGHHQGHSPMHVPYSNPFLSPGGPAVGPYSNPAMMPPQPPMPQTPNQLSPLGKYGVNINMRGSPNLGPVPPMAAPPVQAHPHGHPHGGGSGGRSPRNFPNNNNGSGGSAGNKGFNHQSHNMFMGDMGMGMGKPGAGMPPNDYLSVQQQQQQKNVPPYWNRKHQQPQGPNAGGGGGGGQQPPPMMMGMNKSPSHLGKTSVHGPPQGLNSVMMNKPGGNFGPPATLNDILSPRQPQQKNSPTFFGKDEYWGGGHPGGQPVPGMNGNDSGFHHGARSLGGNGVGPSMFDPSVDKLPTATGASSRAPFDRSDSILTGDDAPYDEFATPSLFGPIERKPSNASGLENPLKGSLSMQGLDLRHQAWLNCTTAQMGGTGGGVNSAQTSPRMPKVPPPPIGTEKKLSPSKDLGMSVGGGSHLLTNDSLIATPAVDSAALWNPMVDTTVNGVAAQFVWGGKAAYPTATATGTMGLTGGSGRSKLLTLEAKEKDDEKDIENGMLELSKNLTNVLDVDDE